MIAVLLLLLLAAPLSAQRLRLPAAVDEYVAGAAGNVVLRLPWIAPAFRQPMPRLALFTALSSFYEGVLDPYHRGNTWQAWRDWGERESAYLAVEFLVAAARRKW